MTRRGWLSTSDGVELELELMGGPDREGSSGLAVVCHPHPLHGGDMFNTVVRTLAKASYQVGYLVLAFNFRGTGRSGGTHTGGLQEVEDVAAAMARAREMAGEGPVLLMGYSFGALVATRWLNAGGRAEAFVGVAVPERAEYPEYKDIPSLYINGELDDIAPIHDGMTRAMMVDGIHVIVENADHFFHTGRDEVEGAVAGFIDMTAPLRSPEG